MPLVVRRQAYLILRSESNEEIAEEFCSIELSASSSENVMSSGNGISECAEDAVRDLLSCIYNDNRWPSKRLKEELEDGSLHLVASFQEE